ncbi:MAG: thiamine phosphate synthase [Pseudomonadota bacterium]
MSQPQPRLYLETPDQFDPEGFATALDAVLATVPVACLRLTMAAQADEAEITRAANHLITICHDHDVPLVVTDHFRLVEPLGLDGVHLATSRTPMRDVRSALGPDRIIGAYAGASRHQGMVLAEAGADYVAFGPVGDSGALGDEGRAEDELFAWWAEMIETPSVAEGALSLADAERLAPITDFAVPDPRLWSSAGDAAEAFNAFAAALPDLESE